MVTGLVPLLSEAASDWSLEGFSVNLRSMTHAHGTKTCISYVYKPGINSDVHVDLHIPPLGLPPQNITLSQSYGCSSHHKFIRRTQASQLVSQSVIQFILNLILIVIVILSHTDTHSHTHTHSHSHSHSQLHTGVFAPHSV